MKKIIKLCLSLVLAIVIAFSSTAVFANAQATKNPKAITSNSAQYGKYIYYASGNKIRRLNTETRKYKTIKTFASYARIRNVDVKDGWIYFVRVENNEKYYVCRVKTTGESYKKLAEDSYYYVIYGNKIYYSYYIGNDYSGTYKMSLSGKDKTYVYYCAETFKIYKNKIYYKQGGLAVTMIISVDLNGKNIKELLTLSDCYYLTDFDLYRDRVYYIYGMVDFVNFKPREYKLCSMSIDGSDSKIHDSIDKIAIENMNFYSGYIYYNKGNNIYNINLETSKRTLHKSSASLLAKNKEGTYYLDLKDNNIYRRISKTSRACIKKESALTSGYYSLFTYGEHLILTTTKEDEYRSIDVKISYCDKNGKNSRNNIGSYTYKKDYTENW